jgi:diadenosine tetraphosphatase ApaH/serine/threonine PP2A family protein phosphatase
LAAAEGHYDEILCCGDLVGYGPRPNEVVGWASETLRAVVRGNHDKVAAGLEDMEGYNLVAVASLGWTKQRLEPPSLRYLTEMKMGPLEHGDIWLMHGSPVDEDLYLIQECDAKHMVDDLPGPVSFFGHTHRQGGFLFWGRKVRTIGQVGIRDSHYILDLSPEAKYLINPGSVGQPRDGDPRAAYCIYDSELRTVRFGRAAYDVESVLRDTLEAGLPELLGRRLLVGR